jgi:hypothetical protein
MRHSPSVFTGELASAVSGDNCPGEQFGRFRAGRRQHVRGLVVCRGKKVRRLVSRRRKVRSRFRSDRWEWFGQVISGDRHHARRFVDSLDGVDVGGLGPAASLSLRLHVAGRWRTVRRRRLAGFATVPLWFLRGLVR